MAISCFGRAAPSTPISPSLKPERGLYPSDPKKRAMVDQWSYWQAVHLGPAMQRIVFERMLKKMFGMGEPDEKAIEPSLKEVAQFLPMLDADLADKEWVAGDLSLADFAIASILSSARRAHIARRCAACRRMDCEDGGASVVAGRYRAGSCDDEGLRRFRLFRSQRGARGRLVSARRG